MHHLLACFPKQSTCVVKCHSKAGGKSCFQNVSKSASVIQYCMLVHKAFRPPSNLRLRHCMFFRSWLRQPWKGRASAKDPTAEANIESLIHGMAQPRMPRALRLIAPDCVETGNKIPAGTVKTPICGVCNPHPTITTCLVALELLLLDVGILRPPAEDIDRLSSPRLSAHSAQHARSE